MITGLNRNITTAGAKIRYDAQCKKVLADRQVLAWILKYATEEFADMSLADIHSCIESEPQITTECIDFKDILAYNYNKRSGDAITGLSNEDSVPGEGAIYYDIRFKAFLPHWDGSITILINLEAQKNFYPGYSLVTRGVFYGARMISSQLETEFTIPKYDDIKKVYSIWLCMDAPEYIGNAVTQFCMEKKDLLGNIPAKRREYDKLSVVMICLNEKCRTNTAFTEVMNTLLSETIQTDRKKEILKKKFHFVMERPLEEEVSLMCNLSELVWERGVNEGLKRGIRQGIEQGIEQVVANMLHRQMSDADISALAGCSLEFIEAVRTKTLH